MSSYSMSEIVSITGIKAHTLRKWETRYNFIEAKRTPTNIRYYNDDQLRKLLNIGILKQNGYRISDIATMPLEKINTLVATIQLDASPQEDISSLLVLMLEMNEIGFTEILNKHIQRDGIITVITDLIYPFLNHVGTLWGVNKVIPAQEHFVSNLIMQKIFSAIENIPSQKENSPSLILFLLEGESHELGLLLAYYMAKKQGWRVYYLGQSVPTQNIIDIHSITKPDLMMTINTMLRPKQLLNSISKISGKTSAPIAISGGEHIKEIASQNNQLVYLRKPDDFLHLLKHMK